ncbi:MAG: beta-hydroxyacyl-ACP dehydratase [Oscillospiraceae bacterium]|nr:beta-hydroxyacyl-ACP dehydratase [Oscillospiraceae bacterium]
MNQNEIMTILPHRGNMLLIDEAEVVDGTAIGKYTVTGDEWFLDGHFPGNPIVPGVILCEILAQSTCVLLSGGIEAGATPYFTGITSARFKSPVKPGDTIETRCKITKEKAPFYFASGTLSVAGKLCLKAEFSFALVTRSEDPKDGSDTQ